MKRRRCELTDFEGWIIQPELPNKPTPNHDSIPSFSPVLYRYRNLVERFFGKIKQLKSTATRFGRHDKAIALPSKSPPSKSGFGFMRR